MTRIAVLLLFLAVSILPLEASANTCTYSGGPGVATLTVPGFSTTAFSPNVPDGTVLYTTSKNFVGLTGGSVSCTSQVTYVEVRGTTGVPINNIYPSGIAGIGLRLQYSGGPYFPYGVSIPPPPNHTF